jgi:hypothetical protein
MEKSYSRLIGQFILDFFTQQKNRRLLRRISKAYDDGLDDEERKIMDGWKGKQPDMLEGEW